MYYIGFRRCPFTKCKPLTKLLRQTAASSNLSFPEFLFWFPETVDLGSPGPAAVPQTPQWVADVDKVTQDVNSSEEEEEMVKSANMEPSTLQWPENKPEPQILPVKDGESTRTSVKSDCISGGLSRTESEREEFWLREKKTGEGWRWMEMGKENGSGTELRNRVKSTCSEIEVEEMNIMPENSARVFNTNITILHSTSQQEVADHWRDEAGERSPFLGSHGTHGTPLEEYFNDSPITPKSRCCKIRLNHYVFRNI